MHFYNEATEAEQSLIPQMKPLAEFNKYVRSKNWFGDLNPKIELPLWTSKEGIVPIKFIKHVSSKNIWFDFSFAGMNEHYHEAMEMFRRFKDDQRKPKKPPIVPAAKLHKISDEKKEEFPMFSNNDCHRKQVNSGKNEKGIASSLPISTEDDLLSEEDVFALKPKAIIMEHKLVSQIASKSEQDENDNSTTSDENYFNLPSNDNNESTPMLDLEQNENNSPFLPGKSGYSGDRKRKNDEGDCRTDATLHELEADDNDTNDDEDFDSGLNIFQDIPDIQNVQFEVEAQLNEIKGHVSVAFCNADIPHISLQNAVAVVTNLSCTNVKVIEAVKTSISLIKQHTCKVEEVKNVVETITNANTTLLDFALDISKF